MVTVPSSSVPPFVEVRDLVVERRGRRLLGPVRFCLEKADGVTAIIGANGAGKTTLLRALHGLERLKGGAVLWCGVPGSPQTSGREQAFVFQQPILLRRSVIANTIYPLRVRGVSAARAREQALPLLERAGLRDRLNQRATTLSGGEAQKLAFARAMITAPKVLFLDEPTSNLDASATRALESLIAEAAKAGVAVIMTTQDMAQMKRLASRVLFLYKGVVHEQGVPDGLQTPEVCRFVAGELVE